jgi:hypothetical protein
VFEDLDRALELFLSMWTSRTVMAAVELGVFEVLRGEGLAPTDAAARLGLADRPARGLLDTCVALGLLERAMGKLRNSSFGESFFSSRGPYTLRNYVRDERWGWDGWGRLEEVLRADAPPLPQHAGGYRDPTEDFLLDFLHGQTTLLGRWTAARADLEGVSRLMDVGGGSGALSIELCRARPALRAVVVDLPAVAERAAGHITAAGLADRIDTHGADFFADPLPERCDGALFGQLLHDFSPDRVRRLLGRVSDALPGGAPVVLLEIMPNDDRSAPPLAVAFAVAMIVNTQGGDAHTEPQYRAWLEEAGFGDVRVTPTGGRMVTAMIEARKR